MSFKRALNVPDFRVARDRYIILSDLHKGDKQARSDDFQHNEALYCQALRYYLDGDYRLVLNGDVEEGWKTRFSKIVEAYEHTAYALERQFLRRGSDHYVRIYGNHDNDLADAEFVNRCLQPVMASPLRVYPALVLGNRLMITHGHQGSRNSDRRAWLSRQIVRHLWRPLQLLFELKNVRACEFMSFRRRRDQFLYEWARVHDVMMIASHTHRAMFDPLPIQDEEERALSLGEDPVPRYFNTGCCVFTDAITGIEIDQGEIRLVKWEHNPAGQTRRTVNRTGDLAAYLAAP